MKFNTNGMDSEWSEYDGQYCEVIRLLTQDEADIEDVGPMYKVRFMDGTEIDAFEDELTADEDYPIRCTAETCPKKKHCARFTSKNTETHNYNPECSNFDTHYIYYEEAPLSEYVSDTGEYIIPISWEMHSRIKVKANNLEEALKNAEEQIDEIPLPSSEYQDYVVGTFKIDVPDDNYAIFAQSFMDRTDVVI